MNRPMKLLPLTALLFAGAAMAQTFPTKPLRIVTQFVPGSSGDTALRIARTNPLRVTIKTTP